MEENLSEALNTPGQNTGDGKQESPPTKPPIAASSVRDVMAVVLDAVRQAQEAGMQAGFVSQDGVLVVVFKSPCHNITSGLEDGGAMIFVDGKSVVADWKE